MEWKYKKIGKQMYFTWLNDRFEVLVQQGNPELLDEVLDFNHLESLNGKQ